MPNVAFQLYAARAPLGAAISGLSYGGPSQFVFENPGSGQKYYVSQQIDIDGAAAGEEVEISLVRDGGNPANTTVTSATAILLVLTIPILNST